MAAKKKRRHYSFDATGANLEKLMDDKRRSSKRVFEAVTQTMRDILAEVRDIFGVFVRGWRRNTAMEVRRMDTGILSGGSTGSLRLMNAANARRASQPVVSAISPSLLVGMRFKKASCLVSLSS